MGNYSPNTGDLIKSQYAFAMYDEAMGWLGSLEYLVPGQGYMYKNTGSLTSDLYYPKSSLSKSSYKGKGYTKSSVKAWDLVESNYQNNMSVVAEVISDKFSIDENYLLGAFVGQECRAISNPIKTSTGHVYFSSFFKFSRRSNFV